MQSVSVPLDELIRAAAAPKMKRMPKGVKGHIEKNTILEFHPNFLVVDAPAQSKVIQVECGFRETFKVGAKYFHETLKKLPKVERVEISLDQPSNALVILCDGMKVKLIGEAPAKK